MNYSYAMDIALLQIELDRIIAVMPEDERECLLYDYLGPHLQKVIQYQQLDHRSLVIICKSYIASLSSQSKDYFNQWVSKQRSAMLAKATNRVVSQVKLDSHKFLIKPIFAMWLTGMPQVRSRDLTPIFNECDVNSTNLSKALDELTVDGFIEELTPKKGTEKEFALTEAGELKLKRLLATSSAT